MHDSLRPGRRTSVGSVRSVGKTDSQSRPGQRTFALCGLGGMGKTQITISYAFEHRQDYDAVLWAHADSRAKLSESFARFAVELGFRDEENIAKDQVGAKELVTNWLRSTGELQEIL